MAETPSDLELSESIDDWRQSIARSFVPMEVLATSHTPRAFHASVHRQQLGSLGLSVVESDAHTAQRTPRNVARHPADYIKIGYQVSGEGWVVQDGRQVLLGPGDIAIYDTTRPYELTFPARNACVIAQVPRAELPIDPGALGRITARSLGDSSGLTHTLGEMLRLVSQQEHLESAAHRFHVARSLVELITAVLMRASGASGGAESAQSALLASIQRYARAHLAQPDLALTDAASAHHVSVRTAQRLFRAEHTTFIAWLRGERLARAQQRLQSTDDTITTIAHDVGFTSASHFSRAFRAHFGTTARESRGSARH